MSNKALLVNLDPAADVPWRRIAIARLPRVDEAHYAEIDAAMLYIEEARARTERAAAALRKNGADEHLIEALERTQAELSDVARKLRQGTLFAVPSAQLRLG